MTANVLCTSVGNDGFQAIVRALRGSAVVSRLIGVDSNPSAYGLYLADAAAVVPRRQSEVELTDAIMQIARAEKVDLLLPLSTEDVAFYAARRERFEREGVAVAVSPLPGIELANDKHRLHREVQRRGLPVPFFRDAASFDQLEAALHELQADRNPVVVRRQFSTGAQGIKIVRPDIPAAERLFARDNIVISLEDLRRWAAGLDPFIPLQVVEFLPDARYSVDVFLSGGRALAAVVRTEEERIYDMAVLGTIVDRPDVRALAVDVAETLKLEYTVNVQIGLDVGGAARMIEVNPRFPATVDHTVLAGCNMPLWTVCAALGQPFTVRLPAIGTTYRRYWHSLARNAWAEGPNPAFGARAHA